MLVIIEANPVYSAPVDLDLGKKMAKVPLRIRLGLYNDETSELCHWHIPQAHYLEAWSDIRGYDGTVSILQPLVTPLYYGKSPHELLATLLEAPNRIAVRLCRIPGKPARQVTSTKAGRVGLKRALYRTRRPTR